MKRSLAVDLGGTHIRLQLVGDDARPAPVHVIETSGVTSFRHAVAQWRERAGMHEKLDAIAVAAAGPVAGGRVRVTNLDWTLDARAIERDCHARRCLLVNDVTAIAWALPSLGGSDVREIGTEGPNGHAADDVRGFGAGQPDDARPAGDMRGSGAGGPSGHTMDDALGLGAGDPDTRAADDAPGLGPGHPDLRAADDASGLGAGDPDTRTADDTPGLGPGHPNTRAARAVIAPGTGLGVSGLVPVGAEDFAVIQGEGGHRTLAAQNPREWAIVAALAERFGHASAERALSGPGIEAIWRALASIDGARRGRDRTAAEIAQDAFAHSDPVAEETIAVFTGFLGSVAGDLALTLGARGGMYIAGGIVSGWGERFDAARFLDRFRAKGRFRAYLSAVPVHVVTHPYPGLVGVERLLGHRIADGS